MGPCCSIFSCLCSVDHCLSCFVRCLKVFALSVLPPFITLWYAQIFPGQICTIHRNIFHSWSRWILPNQYTWSRSSLCCCYCLPTMCHVNYLYFYVLFIQISTLLRSCYVYLYLWTNTFPVDVWRQIGCYKTTPPSPTMCNWRTDTINKMLSPISCDIFTFLEWCFPEVNIHLMFITWQSLFTTCVVWCINNLSD
jgi:hypothetical protein